MNRIGKPSNSTVFDDVYIFAFLDISKFCNAFTSFVFYSRYRGYL